MNWQERQARVTDCLALEMIEKMEQSNPFLVPLTKTIVLLFFLIYETTSSQEHIGHMNFPNAAMFVSWAASIWTKWINKRSKSRPIFNLVADP